MAVIYCSWQSGDDTTGDGTMENPYKTITKATTGAVGGDEIRLQKNQDPTSLTGKFNFTQGSMSITGTNTLFTSELQEMDFIKDPEGNWQEVDSITDATTLSLWKRYTGPTTFGVASQKLAVTPTGSGYSSYEAVQEVMASGTATNRILISGGWNFNTGLQDGHTNLMGEDPYRYGVGIEIDTKDYIEIRDLRLLRYYYSLYVDESNGSLFENIYCGSFDYRGIYMRYSNRCVFRNISCISGDGYGMVWWYSNDGELDTIMITDAGYTSIDIEDAYNNVFRNIEVRYCGYGPEISYAHDNKFYGVKSMYNDYDGMYFSYYCHNNSFYDVFTTGNGDASIYCSNYVTSGCGKQYFNGVTLEEDLKWNSVDYYALEPSSTVVLYLDNYNGRTEIWAYGVTVITQEPTIGGTGIEWKVNITSADRVESYPFSMQVALVAVEANKQVTATLYCKKSHATGMGAKLFMRGGQISGAPNDLEDYCWDNTGIDAVTIQFTPTEDGVVELEFLVWSVSELGNVIFDDIYITQE